MPYLHLDLAKTYSSELKRELATRLCRVYAELMQTQSWRPNVGIAELGEDNLFHLGKDGLESITMVLVETRRGRSLDVRLELGRRIVDICAEVLSVSKGTVLVEFTVHRGDEMLRNGEWAGDWSAAEAGAAKPSSGHDMTQATAQSSITARTIAVEHIRISSGRPFAEIHRKLEATVPKLDTGIVEALQSGDQRRAKAYEENGPKLSIFGERDHGALLEIAGGGRNAVQYDIGNPLTASKMTRHQLPAALYAPLRVVLFEDEQGRGIFEYDRPSSFFSQYGDERVTEVGRYLDATLEAALRDAAD